MKTPVLFCIFNRLDIVKQTIEPIKESKPPRLYIAADGPRPSQEGERELTESVRNFVLDNINWDCEVKTLFREENLGCEVAMSSALEWFFTHEEEGIIIEDDILTSSQFFEFCELMLDTYRNEEKIRYIGGYNHIPDLKEPADYLFLSYTLALGWAAWRRSFYPDEGVQYKYYPYNFYEKNCNPQKILDQITTRKDLRKMQFNTLFKCYQWDAEFFAYGLIHNPNSCAILPNKNLTSHIGDYGQHFNGNNNNFNIPINEFNISSLNIKDTIAKNYNFQETYFHNFAYNRDYILKYINKNNIDIDSVKKDYWIIRLSIIKAFLVWFYYRYIKFKKKRASTEWELYKHYNIQKSMIEPFYIYVTQYYNK